MSFAAGSLVRARNREWVVLPDSTEDFLLLRPLGGANDEVSGILTALENVEPATFTLPNPARAGDHRAARLLRDAARIGFRSSAGPFRSFGAIAVEPRPYQLVPLLMALRLDPVRLLIADDVGIGKTIEAGLIAKELLVSGDAKRLAVLCPPHLAEQWQKELAAKFHIDTELVLASTAGRLERSLGPGESIFEVYPYTVVSTDFIKAEKRRSEFLRSAPDLVIVDEAHTCAADASGRSTKHQRYELLRGLASNSERQLLLVTATPHSGNEGAFRSLVGLLDQQFSGLPEDDRIDDATRAKLARYFVQRRRADIRSYLDADTPFPDRLDLPEAQGSYHLSPEYREFVQEILAWAREAVSDESGGKHRQRVRWWSVLALLRSLASSPTAAAATLRNRAAPAQTTTVEEADEAGRRSVLDQDDADDVARPDATPGADPDDPDARGDRAERRRLQQLALQADALSGEQDVKLAHATRLVKSLLKDGYQPIVFCRFIPTADYVAEHLRKVLGKGTAVEAVTGLLPPAERESRVLALGERPRRVLVATDCLSEGINLQDHFDAVVHYDLPWNPTRLEQREGRVDRYGQPSPTVKVATVFGVDNVIDEIVLEVLLRKHKKIRSELGVSIPVPGSNDEFIETIFERLFSRQNVQLGLFSEPVRQAQLELFEEWDRAAEKEKVSRTRYAQHAIKTEAVAAELAAAREAIGSTQDLEHFVRTAVESLGGTVTGDDSSLGRPPLRLSLGELPRAVRDLIATEAETVHARFQLPVRAGEVYLSRTHPLVEGLATYLFDTALDAITDSPAARCGAIRTTAVNSTTTMVLVRNRFDILIGRQAQAESQLLAEGLDLVAFRGNPSDQSWLTDAEAQALLNASPSANVSPDERERFVRHVFERFDSIRPALEERARLRAKELATTHLRVRQHAGLVGRVSVTAHHPTDVLGLYLYLPA
ncbi:MAG: helicase-related protein [Actinomycetota bacterium]|nr:helicase-related protein [Actinomycetota bacterium]